MEIKLNNERIEYQPEFPITWKSLLDHLLKNHIDRKHGITELLVDKQNGIEFMTENIEKLVDSNIGLIEINTNDSYVIARKGFEKIKKIIDGIKSESVETADLYREGELKKGAEKIIRIVNAITPVIIFVNHVEKNFKLDFSALQFAENVTVKDKIDYFSNSFEELIGAQEKKDYIELADYLEYQFTDDLEDWESLIAMLADHVGTHSSSK